MNNYTSLVGNSYFKYTPDNNPNTIYIDPTGIDHADRSGSAGDPFRTLQYACTRAVAGQTIHIRPGYYVESVQSLLPVGVNIEGEGSDKCHIHSIVAFATNSTILLSSAAEGTPGNQHISGIRMTGAVTASRAILVVCRGNVSIFNCLIEDFITDGVMFHGRAWGVAGEPVTYANGNQFYNNIVTNCSGCVAGTDGRGNLNIAGQEEMQIHHNTLTTTYRGLNLQGYVMKAQTDGGFNRGLKIYNNIFTRFPFDNTLFDFGIEFWDIRGGVEIYNNDFINCSIDVGGFITTRGAYPYSVWIHDNRLGQTVMTPYEATRGIVLEATTSLSHVIIERNYIYNTCTGINYGSVLASPNTLEFIYIANNIMVDLGVDDTGAASKGWGIYSSSDPASINRYIEHYNNIMVAHIGGVRRGFIGILIPSSDFTTQIKYVNNIILDFSFAAIRGYMAHGITENLDYYWIQNNIFHNNGSTISWEGGYAHTNGFEDDNQNVDPLFFAARDFRLQAGSPAINTARLVYAIDKDFALKKWELRDIGAYQH